MICLQSVPRLPSSLCLRCTEWTGGVGEGGPQKTSDLNHVPAEGKGFHRPFEVMSPSILPLHQKGGHRKGERLIQDVKGCSIILVTREGSELSSKPPSPTFTF